MGYARLEWGKCSCGGDIEDVDEDDVDSVVANRGFQCNKCKTIFSLELTICGSEDWQVLD